MATPIKAKQFVNTLPKEALMWSDSKIERLALDNISQSHGEYGSDWYFDDNLFAAIEQWRIMALDAYRIDASLVAISIVSGRVALYKTKCKKCGIVSKAGGPSLSRWCFRHNGSKISGWNHRGDSIIITENGLDIRSSDGKRIVLSPTGIIMANASKVRKKIEDRIRKDLSAVWETADFLRVKLT